MQAGWCALCGHEGREEFAWKRANPELVRVTRRSDALLRFVMCARCGHVYQHPMLDADELATLYEPSCVPRWDEHPPDPHELRLWGEWVLHSVPIPRHGAILADFGGGEGPHVEPFRAAGWRITPLTMPLGDASPDAGEIVSVVLMPHTLERLTDPVTVLKAIRKQLPPDGMLALVTADLLSPSVPAHEAQPWLSDSHVRLYSFNSVQTVLTHAGFRPESVRRVAGTGAVAVLASPDEHVLDAEPDDPMSLQELFHAVRHPGAADTLGHNLAALAETQPGVLPALCRKMDTGRYSVRRSGSCLVAVVARLGDLPGEEELPVIHWGDIDGLLEPPQFDASSPQTLVQLGLGSGELATALAEQLHAGQHLFIWEADPVLAKTVLAAVDLSPLWLSTQVSLLIGTQPYRSAAQRRMLREPSLIYSTRSARQWNTWLYRDIISSFVPAEGMDDAAEVPEIADEPRVLHR